MAKIKIVTDSSSGISLDEAKQLGIGIVPMPITIDGKEYMDGVDLFYDEAVERLKKGEVFTKDNITTKRPGSGISPMRWYNVIGAVAKRDFQEDELIEL